MDTEFIEWVNQSWVYILGLSAGLAAILNLAKNMRIVKQKLNAPNHKQDERLNKLEERMKSFDTHYNNCTEKWKRMEHREQELTENFSHLNGAMVALMRDRISCYFDNCTKKGFVTPSELEIVSELYKAYKSMGGNGLITREMEVINKLPICNSEKDFVVYQAQKAIKKG